MTWWRDEEHYEVFFNRDELKTRKPAIPPRLLKNASGIRYLSPSDPVAGGTWMLVNESRVTVCLLNRWHESPLKSRSFTSRGLLVSSMSDCLSSNEVVHRLSKIDLFCYRPFTLVSIDLQEIHIFSWNGQNLTKEPASLPLTSSSFKFAEVSKTRLDSFSEIKKITPENLAIYQQGTHPASAYTVRMNRPDAQTWSRSHIQVFSDQISWQYIKEKQDLADNGDLHSVKFPL